MKIQLIALGYTNSVKNDLSNYIGTLKDIIKTVNGPAFIVLPEYCWGEEISSQTIENGILQLQNILEPDQYLVAGSYVKKTDKGTYNTAIMVDKDKTILEVQKTHVLSEEKKRNGIKKGNNSGVVSINGVKVAIIICADIWDNLLLNRIIKKQQADLLLIPAFTVVPQGFADYAQTQWYSLAVVRSREYLVPIVIADHHRRNTKFEAGGATCIADPSKKVAGMTGFKGFLELPDDKMVTSKIDLEEISEYKQYRIDKGLFSEKVI